MDLVLIAVVASGLFAYSLISERLQGTVITAPLVFIIFGFLIGDGGLAVVSIQAEHGLIHTIAELTLILILFTDAARIDLSLLRRDHNLPVRMLTIGLPLTIAAGVLIAVWLFPEFTLWEAALLAALLAPTDAALGQSVVSSKIVPVRIRQAINVESGLNDGIALPIVLLLAAFASTASEVSEASDWIRFGLMQVTLGPIVGVAIGYIGARLLDFTTEKKWIGESFQGIGILALVLLAFVSAEMVGGNGFIAAFVGGMVFGNTIRHACASLFEFMETDGQLLMLITFMVFGAVLLPEGLRNFDLTVLLYAILSLTIIRMIPVAFSLIGTGVKLPTLLFLGWFGPRGLASILFVLLILEEYKFTHHEELLSITVVTVGLSTLAHGVSAAPFAKIYGRLVAQMGECAENKQVSEHPLRKGPSNPKSSE